MRLTPFSFAKIRWILSQKSFYKSPLRALYGILNWEINRLFNRSKIIKFDRNLNLYVEPNDGTGRLITYFKFHEPDFFDFLNSFLKPGMTFVDIGANIGAYTIFAAKRVGPIGHVFAFEPNPENFRKLQLNVILNRFMNVSLFQNALTDQTREVYLRWDEDSAKHSVTHLRSDGQSVVKALCLDSLLDRLPSSIDYIKIDTVGFELSVLNGAMELLNTYPPNIIQLELPKNGDEVAALLRDSGYELFNLVKKGNIFKFVKCKIIPQRPIAIHKSFDDFRLMLP